MSVAFNGVVLVAPGVASYIDDSTSSAAPVASGNALAILGEAERGETGKPVLFTDPATMRAYYGVGSLDSPLVWGISRAMNSGALRVYGVRVGNATQSSTMLVSKTGSSAISVNADEWGYVGNSWSLTVSTNAANPKNKDLTLMLHDGREYSATNIGKNVLQLEYFTTNTGVAPTVAIGSDGDVVKLYLTVPQNVNQTTTITLTEYDTISKLISKINQYYTASTPKVSAVPEIPAGSGGAPAASTLAAVGVSESTGTLQITVVDDSDANSEVVLVPYAKTQTLGDFASSIQTSLRAAGLVGSSTTASLTNATVTYAQTSGFAFSTGSTARFSGLSALEGNITGGPKNIAGVYTEASSTIVAKCFPNSLLYTFPHIAGTGGVVGTATLESTGLGFDGTNLSLALRDSVTSTVAGATWNPVAGTTPTWTAEAVNGSGPYTGTFSVNSTATLSFKIGDIITGTHTVGGANTTLTVTANTVAGAQSVAVSSTTSLASGTFTFNTITVTRSIAVSLPYTPSFGGSTFSGLATAWTSVLTGALTGSWASGTGFGSSGTVTATYLKASGYAFAVANATSGHTVTITAISGSSTNATRFGLNAVSLPSGSVQGGIINIASTTIASYSGGQTNTALVPAVAEIPAVPASGWRASLATGMSDSTMASIKLDRLDTTYVPTSAQISASSASFTGYITGNVLTVSAVSNGAVAVGQVLVGDGVVSGTTVIANVSGTGASGTYTVSVSNTVGSSSSLVAFTASATALSKLNLRAVTNAIVETLNGPLLGALVTASLSNSSFSPAAILDKTYTFSGASEAEVTPTHWDAALAGLQALEDVEIIVPMTPSSSIQASVLSHCLSMSSATGKRERFMVVGGDRNLSVDAVKSLAAKFADKRAVVVWPGIQDYDDNGQLTTWPPTYLAATIGGMLAAQSDVAQPLTAKSIPVRGLETVARLADLDDLVSNGVLAVRYDSGRGYTITQSLTTWTGDTRYARREISTMRAADATMKLIRNSVSGFIGSKLSDRAIDQITNRVSQALKQANVSGLIVGTPSSPAYKDLIVRNVGDSIYVDVSISPAIPINYLLITAHIL
ncbi:hypothetical protein EBR57_00035 [bacterium]|nr:hypothetical protein [bacterium]